MEGDHPGSQFDRKRKSECAEDVTIIIGSKSAKPAKRTEPDSATTPDSGGTFEHLLTSTQASMQQAIAAGEERLALIDDKYYAGVETGVHSELLDLIHGLNTSTNRLQALTESITSKSEKASIYELPNEIFFLIFTYLDTEAMSISKGVCQRWRNILGTQAAKHKVWRSAPHAVYGTVAQLDAKRRRNIAMAGLSKTLSLKLYMSPSDRKLPVRKIWERLEATEVSKKFPSESLHTFIFDSTLGVCDLWIWEWVVKCQKLKVLHWKSYGYPFGVKFCFDVLIYSPLARCRLEEMKVDVDTKVQVHPGFLRTLSQLKRLHLVNGLNRDQLLAIMTAAEHSIEELTVTKLGCIGSSSGRGLDEIEIHHHFIMQRLTKIHTQDKDMGVLDITAPNAKSVRFDHSNVIDWTLLASCRSSVQYLHIVSKGAMTEGGLDEELFHMPQLQELHLEFGPQPGFCLYEKVSGEIPSFEPYSIAAFWKAVRTDDVEKLRSSLPRLEVLQIVHDPLLDEDVFISYINIRATLGQPALQKINLLLANQSGSTTALDALRKTELPGLSYQPFREWRVDSTEEWRILTNLQYKVRSVGIL